MARASKSKFISEMNKILRRYRKEQLKVLEEEGLSFGDPMADTFIRDEGVLVALYYDGAGYDYLSSNSQYETPLREKIIEKADSLGWMADDETDYSMVFWPA